MTNQAREFYNSNKPADDYERQPFIDALVKAYEEEDGITLRAEDEEHGTSVFEFFDGSSIEVDGDCWKINDNYQALPTFVKLHRNMQIDKIVVDIEGLAYVYIDGQMIYFDEDHIQVYNLCYALTLLKPCILQSTVYSNSLPIAVNSNYIVKRKPAGYGDIFAKFETSKEARQVFNVLTDTLAPFFQQNASTNYSAR